MRRHHRELRYLLYGWSIISAVGATIGGIIGWINIENDTRR